MSDNYWDKLMDSDEGAASYMETYGEGPGSETRNIIASFINEKESVLDVGCGPGWNFDHFREYGPRIGIYKGTDYSERFVRIANERFKQKFSPGFRENSWHKAPFEVGDVRHFKEPDNSWDVVILQDVLEHTNGYERPLREAMRVAKKRIIVTFWRGQMMDDFHDDGIDRVRDDGDDGHCGEYSRIAFEKFLDSLDVHWLETQTPEGANRWHIFYVIDKEEPHGKQ